MGMGISTYYYKPLPSENNDDMIVAKIETIIELLPESGYRSVTRILKRTQTINRKRVERIMGENRLSCRKHKAFRIGTTDSRHRYLKYPNIAKDVVTTGINQVIVGDVTAYNVKGKDHYCAILTDRHNHEAISVAVSNKNDTDLIIVALESAH